MYKATPVSSIQAVLLRQNLQPWPTAPGHHRRRFMRVGGTRSSSSRSMGSGSLPAGRLLPGASSTLMVFLTSSALSLSTACSSGSAVSACSCHVMRGVLDVDHVCSTSAVMF